MNKNVAHAKSQLVECTNNIVENMSTIANADELLRILESPDYGVHLSIKPYVSSSNASKLIYDPDNEPECIIKTLSCIDLDIITVLLERYRNYCVENHSDLINEYCEVAKNV